MDPSERRNRVEAEAAEWFVLLQGNPARAQCERYVDWLRESPVHVAEMLRVAQLNNALERFASWGIVPTDGPAEATDTVVDLPVTGRTRRPSSSFGTGAFRLASVSALLLIIISVSGAWWLNRSRGEIMQTSLGERRSISLADGSVIDLDTQTLVRVKYEPHARMIYLEHGRALFHVAKNRQRPFWVQSDHAAVRAVGTAFSVERVEKSVIVTVAEGTVAVFARDEHPAISGAVSGASAELSSEEQRTARGSPSTGSPRPGGMITMSPGHGEGVPPGILVTVDQQITVTSEGTAEAVRRVDSRKVLAWAEGRLIFEHQTVAEAAREFNRYNRIQLTIDDPDLAQRPISGVFDASNPESFIAFIRAATAVTVVQDDAGNLTIMASRKDD